MKRIVVIDHVVLISLLLTVMSMIVRRSLSNSQMTLKAALEDVFKLVNIQLVTYSVSEISVSNALIFQPVVLTSESHRRSIFL